MERAVGMAYYASEGEGTGGRLRETPEDFRVRELERFETEPLDSDVDAYPHIVCRVTLRGWDTNDFARTLSNRLGVSRERIDWAGTKDKYAVSTQLLSIQGRGLDPGELPSIADSEIEVLGRSGRGLYFGDLAGNAFEVRVSDLEAPENALGITEELRALGAGVDDWNSKTSNDENADDPDATDMGDGPVPIGVPNYFGQQRFGSRRPVTHAVGLAICRRDWEQAVMAYVGNPRESEPEATQAARRFAEGTREWAVAAEKFPGGLRYERAICGRLAERESTNGAESDSEGSSNGEIDAEDFRAALDVLPQNLQQLFVNAAQSYLFNRMVSERLDRGLPLARAVPGDIVCFTDREAPTGLSLPDVSRQQRVEAGRVETIDRHCARGRAFVTAPLVGTETDFSEGEPGAIEREVLAEEGLARSDFDLPESYYSSGTRRAICCRTDIDVTLDPFELSFRLPKGSYATTVLREYLKVPPTDRG